MVQLGYGNVNILFQRSALQQAVVPTVLVRLSPQTALILGKLLQHAIAAYEDRFGPLPVPEALLAELGLSEQEGSGE